MGWTVRLMLLLAVAASSMCGMQSAAADIGGLAATATVAGHDVATATSSDAIWLIPNESVDVVIEMTNTGAEPVTVRQVEFVGRVLGLNFFSYATPVEATVLPGGSQTLSYRLNLTGLQGQATGLIGAELNFTDEAGKTIASIPTVADVRGSLMSVYGLFGVALVALTALALVDVAIAVAQHRLSTNRWKRGMRLLMPGIGIGLVIAFSASVLRLWIPDTGLWVVIAGLTAVVFFALGYFSPTPDEDDDPDDDEFDELAVSDLDTEDMSAREFRQ